MDQTLKLQTADKAANWSTTVLQLLPVLEAQRDGGEGEDGSCQLGGLGNSKTIGGSLAFFLDSLGIEIRYLLYYKTYWIFNYGAFAFEV